MMTTGAAIPGNVIVASPRRRGRGRPSVSWRWIAIDGALAPTRRSQWRTRACGEDWTAGLVDAIVKSPEWRRRPGPVLVLELPEKPAGFEFGALTASELQVLAGHRALARRRRALTAAVDIAKTRALLRLSNDGFLEIIPFDEIMTLRTRLVPRSRSLTYPMRLVAAGRGATLGRDLSLLVDAGRALRPLLLCEMPSRAAAEAMRNAFVEKILPFLKPRPVRRLRDRVEIEAGCATVNRVVRLIEVTLIAEGVPNECLPVLCRIQLPFLGCGIPRFYPIDMQLRTPLPDRIVARLYVLINAAAFDLHGGAAIRIGLAGFASKRLAPLDTMRPISLSVCVSEQPSAHRRLEARGEVAAMWRRMRSDPFLSRVASEPCCRAADEAVLTDLDAEYLA
jgi:hypothetical protein